MTTTFSASIPDDLKIEECTALGYEDPTETQENNIMHNAHLLAGTMCTAKWIFEAYGQGPFPAPTTESFATLMAVDGLESIGPEGRTWDAAILDLGCSATVAGRTWVDEFIRKSNCDTKRYQKESKSFAGFTGEQVESREAILLHMVVLGCMQSCWSTSLRQRRRYSSPDGRWQRSSYSSTYGKEQ